MRELMRKESVNEISEIIGQENLITADLPADLRSSGRGHEGLAGQLHESLRGLAEPEKWPHLCDVDCVVGVGAVDFFEQLQDFLALVEESVDSLRRSGQIERDRAAGPDEIECLL